MAKQSLPQINQLSKYLTKETLLPIYFLCGQDSYTIEQAVDAIEKVVSPLLGSIGKADKSKSLEVGFHLLDSGVEIVFVINMVAKFIMTVAQILDSTRQRISENEGARLAGVSYYYYINCKKATFFMSDTRLHNASRALLNADLAVKSSGMDHKTVLQMLISELLGEVATSPLQN